jgi:hypothetical protein
LNYKPGPDGMYKLEDDIPQLNYSIENVEPVNENHHNLKETLNEQPHKELQPKQIDEDNKEEKAKEESKYSINESNNIEENKKEQPKESNFGKINPEALEDNKNENQSRKDSDMELRKGVFSFLATKF